MNPTANNAEIKDFFETLLPLVSVRERKEYIKKNELQEFSDSKKCYEVLGNGWSSWIGGSLWL